MIKRFFDGAKNVMLTTAIPILSGMFAANTGSHQWGIFEAAIESDVSHDNPLQDVTLRVEFTGPDGGQRHCEGFWDGDSIWRVRFSSDKMGEWTWQSQCSEDQSLDGKKGRFTCSAYAGSNPFYQHGAVRVSDNRRHFAHADGTPFFWLVDTVWNGALLSNERDWEQFLGERVSQRFTGVQFVMTQWRAAYADAQGQVAYSGFEEIEVHPAFFQRLDHRINAINAKGLLAAPVMLWTLGKKEHNPGLLPEDQAVRLARYMVARYGAHHVIWILPGDGGYFDENAERWKRIGRGVFDTEDHAPVFTHPQGIQWPYDEFLNEKWLSAFGYQSGHGDDANALRWIHSGPPAEKWLVGPPRPLINLEPPYEDHIAYQSRKPHTDYNVRRAIYWSLLNAPTAGTSYGAHGVWSWEIAPKVPQDHDGAGVAQPWHKAVNFLGGVQMKYMAELFTCIDWWRLRPAELVIQRPGDEEAVTHISASCSDEGDLAVIYSPTGGKITMKSGILAEGIKAQWFNPRNGKRTPAGKQQPSVYITPDHQDWVLLLQSN